VSITVGISGAGNSHSSGKILRLLLRDAFKNPFMPGSENATALGGRGGGADPQAAFQAFIIRCRHVVVSLQ